MPQADDRWRGRRVLITGGAGFFGRAVVELLVEFGAEVVGLVRSRTSAAAFARHQLAGKIHIIHGRTEDLFRVHSALAVHDVQAVFHFAAAEPIGQDRGTTTLLEAVRRFNPRLPVVVAQPADAASIILSPVPLGAARFGKLFGPGDANRILGDPPLTESEPRDLVHVDDAARACLMLAEAVSARTTPHVHETTFRTGWRLTDRAFFEAIRIEMDGRAARTSFDSPPSNPLGWQPSFNFPDAIADTVRWARTFALPSVSAGRGAEFVRRAA